MPGSEDFQPKQIATVQCQTGSASPGATTKSKSPQVAVIPPLVDLTKVASETGPGEEGKNQKKEEKSKGQLERFSVCRVVFELCLYFSLSLSLFFTSKKF